MTIHKRGSVRFRHYGEHEPMRISRIIMAAACLAPMITLADDEVEKQLKDDVILRALVDELERERTIPPPL